MNKASIIFGDRDLSEENNFKCPNCGCTKVFKFESEVFNEFLKDVNMKVCANCSLILEVNK